MRYAFRVDSGFEVGLGHIKRCISLASFLKTAGADILFICRACDGHATHLLDDGGFDYVLLPMSDTEHGTEAHTVSGVDWKEDVTQTCVVIQRWSREVDWLIVDHYDIDHHWHSSARLYADHLAVLDDEADSEVDCDILLNPMGFPEMYQKLISKGCVVASGLEYALLHPSYLEHRTKSIRQNQQIKRVLLFFGGSDRPNLTASFLKMLIRYNSENPPNNAIVVDVVTTAANADVDEINALSASLPFVNHHHDLPSLLPLLDVADLAIGGGGTSVYERLCVGVYSLVVTLAENQEPLAKLMHERKALHWFGDYATVDLDAAEAKLVSLLRDGLTLDQLSATTQTIDGAGVIRFAKLLEQFADDMRCTRVRAEDESLMLSMANDPIVRAQSFSMETISSAQHAEVFGGWLEAHATVRIFIMWNSERRPVGQIRFEFKDGSWLIDYSLVSCFRGVGLGKRLLRYGVRQLWREFPGAHLTAHVKTANLPSYKVFEGLRFDCTSQTKDVTRFSVQPLR